MEVILLGHVLGIERRELTDLVGSMYSRRLTRVGRRL